MKRKIRFVFGIVWRDNRKLFFASIFQIPVLLILPYLTLYLTKSLIDGIERQYALHRYIVGILGIFLLQMILTGMRDWLDAAANWRSMLLVNDFLKPVDEKTMDTDYANVEGIRGQKCRDKALNAVYVCGQKAMLQFTSFTVNLFGLLLYGATVGTYNGVILFLVIATTCGGYLLAELRRGYEKKQKEAVVECDNKMRYLENEAVSLQAAREIRLYDMSGLMDGLYKEHMGHRVRLEKRISRVKAFISGGGSLLSFVRNFGAYYYLIHLAVTGRITAADFVLLAGLVSKLSGYLGGVMGGVGEMRKMGMYLEDYFAWLDLPEETNRYVDGISEKSASLESISAESANPERADEEKASVQNTDEEGADSESRGKEDTNLQNTDAEKIETGGMGEGITRTEGAQVRNVPIPHPEYISSAPKLEFKEVCFRYEGAGEDTLKNISFTVMPGEKLAIVGRNGAGKTTLIKLLSGLYRPDKGKILLDGKDITDYDMTRFRKGAYYRAISAVFQEIVMLPVGISQNVSSHISGRTDPAKVRESLEMAGIYERIMQFPQGIDTPMGKTVREDGVDLSGGEQQKVMLAKAVYKDARVLILDEPTAALDPVSENDIYQKYNQLTRGMTSLFISHRLASTSFCDNIILLDGGTIMEQGSHKELMEARGEYWKMFTLQSHYYNSGALE